MATQAERLEALTSTVSGLAERISDMERLIKDGETLDELRSLVAKAAPLSDFEDLTEKVDQLAKNADAREDFSLMGDDGQPITAELVEGYDPRGEVLKAFRQIEAIANHLNFRLPA